MRNIRVKLLRFWASSSLEDVFFFNVSYLQVWWPSCLAELNHLGSIVFMEL